MLVIGLAAMACVAQRRLSYQETVSEALRIFNRWRRGQPLFGLLEAIPPPSSVSVHRSRPGDAGDNCFIATACEGGRRAERLAQAQSTWLTLAIDSIVRMFLPPEGKKRL